MKNMNEIKKGYIYKITNKVTGKVFIGYNSSIPLVQVISRDKSNVKNGVHKHTKLYAAIREFGFSTFTYEIILEVPMSNGSSELLRWYHIAIAEFDSIENGYNDVRGKGNPKHRLHNM